MLDKLDKLVVEYHDLYTAPNEERAAELDFKIAELEWEGLYLSAPAKVDAAAPGIPILALMRRSDLLEWEVNLEKNSAIVFTHLESGVIGMCPLHKPPVKRMKPQNEDRGRKPEPGEGYSAGSIRRVIGDSQSEPLAQGDYSVNLISWDCLTNQRIIHKDGKPKPFDPAVAVAAWPWERWSVTKSFQAGPASPVLEAGKGIALKVDGHKDSRFVSGAVAARARAFNVISPDPKRAALAGVQAGIKVTLLLFRLDKYPPESAEIPVPILGTGPIRVGDEMKGWFTLPFPFPPSAGDRMLYAMADGKVIGPIKIPGEKR
ncbi:MAG: hypothetical protein JWP91_1161 [Fibrobacteres bacterium]|nr:hypothetical protein [Fibrobacterota bacterium]